MKKLFLILILCFITLFSAAAIPLTGLFDVTFGDSQITAIEKMLNRHWILTESANNFSELCFVKLEGYTIADAPVDFLDFTFSDSELFSISIYFKECTTEEDVDILRKAIQKISQLYNCTYITDIKQETLTSLIGSILFNTENDKLIQFNISDTDNGSIWYVDFIDIHVVK